MPEKKKNKRRKSLGELGELFAIKALVDNSFEKIINLNDKKMNYPFADFYAEKDGNRYVISMKARNKYQKSGELNSSYNLLYDGGLEKARNAEKEYKAEAYWMVIPFEEETFSVYFGSVKELLDNNLKRILIPKCQEGNLGICLLKDKRHYFDWDFFSNQISSSK